MSRDSSDDELTIVRVNSQKETLKVIDDCTLEFGGSVIHKQINLLVVVEILCR